jgi:hypothetical protein
MTLLRGPQAFKTLHLEPVLASLHNPYHIAGIKNTLQLGHLVIAEYICIDIMILK